MVYLPQLANGNPLCGILILFGTWPYRELLNAFHLPPTNWRLGLWANLQLTAHGQAGL
jgi:hypothetical protein